MTRMRKAAVAGSAVLVVAGVLAPGALGGAQASKSKKVSVLDSYFAEVGKDEKANTERRSRRASRVHLKWSADNSRPRRHVLRRSRGTSRRSRAGPPSPSARIQVHAREDGHVQVRLTIHSQLRLSMTGKSSSRSRASASGWDPRPCTGEGMEMVRWQRRPELRSPVSFAPSRAGTTPGRRRFGARLARGTLRCVGVRSYRLRGVLRLHRRAADGPAVDGEIRTIEWPEWTLCGARVDGPRTISSCCRASSLRCAGAASAKRSSTRRASRRLAR